MSTRAIREALKQLQEYSMHADHDGDWNLAISARAEVEAIEKACVRIAGGYIGTNPTDDEDGAHVALLDAIGEESAQRNAGTVSTSPVVPDGA